MEKCKYLVHRWKKDEIYNQKNFLKMFEIWDNIFCSGNHQIYPHTLEHVTFLLRQQFESFEIRSTRSMISFQEY